MMALVVMVKRGEFSIDVYAKIMRINWLYIVDTIFCQISVSPRRGVNRLVWITVAIGLFVIIRGYVWNLIKVEKVALIPKPQINSIESLLYEPEFADHQIVLFKSFYFYRYLRSSKDPELRHLYDRMMSTNDCSTLDRCNFLEFKRNSVVFNALLEKFQAGIRDANAVLILNKNFIRSGANYFVCALFPEIWSKVEISNQPFASDLLVWFYNKRLPSNIKRYMDYLTMTIDEFRLNEMRQKEFMSIVVDSVTGGLKKIDDWSNIACVDNAEDKSKETSLPAPMDIETIRSSVVPLLWSILLIGFVLGIEIVRHLWLKRKTDRKLKLKGKVRKCKVTTTRVVVIRRVQRK